MIRILISLVWVLSLATFMECFANDEICIPTSTLPTEKVYLHIDNTRYNKGDKIWFKAYIVNATGNTATSISNTLYVELLNPGGELIERKTYKVEAGQAYGDFTIKHLPFYSGLYELRAYTKYMLNFGEDNYFSRVIPILDNSKQYNDNNYKSLSKRVNSKYNILRKHPKKKKELNLTFYPEGGCLIKGIPTRVAFEITNEVGHPLDIKGEVLTDDTTKIAELEVSHEGKGIFTYTPTDREAQAIVTYNDKKYKFKLPKPLDMGYALSVDNLTDESNIKVRISKSGEERKDTIGVILLSQGQVIDYAFLASTFKKPLDISFSKDLCLPGISELLLVDKNSERIASRYIFKYSDNTFPIITLSDKNQYDPLQPINITFSLKQKDGSPITSPFSLSVRDVENEINRKQNILTDLLLMSDIKGYVSNPAYYFESDDDKHRMDLDLLLMVQGWEKYPWNNIRNLNNNNLIYKPESRGITIDGTVSYYNVKKPKGDIDVSMIMTKKEKDKENDTFFNDKFTTDSLGRFHFIVDVDGDWNLVLATSKNLKRKNLTISLDNKFSPKPRNYDIQEINEEMTDKNAITSDDTNEEVLPLDEDQTKLNEPTGDDDKKQQEEKITMLKEIEVKGKNSSKSYDIFRARSNSVAYYDLKESVDQMYDNGFYYCDDVNTFLCKVNQKFQPMVEGGFKYLIYNWKVPLVVVDYEITYIEDEFRYNDLPVEWIKSVYVSEDSRLIYKYSDPRITPELASKRFGCVVFIETHPEEERPAAAAYGVRKTTLHGYDTPTEFYNPDYSDYIPDEEDQRQTLYWNPMVTPDENGNVKLKIYNNSNVTHPIIDAQTVTSSGLIGISR